MAKNAIKVAEQAEQAKFEGLLGRKPKVVGRDGTVKPTGKVHFGDGLYLTVGAGSQRSWLFKFRLDGKDDSLGLGSAHKVDLKAARQAADEARALLRDKINPKTPKQAKKAAREAEKAKAPEPSLYELASEAVKTAGPPKTDLHGKWVASLKPKLVNGITAKAPRNITREDVITALNVIRERTTAGAQAVAIEQRLRTMFEWCAEKGYFPKDTRNPADLSRQVKKIILQRPKREPLERAAIDWRKIGAVMATVRAERTMANFCLDWTALSVVRVGTAITADWREIDLDARVWKIPAGKMKVKKHGAHHVPLTDRHLEILAAVMPESGKPSGLLFRGRFGGAIKTNTILQALRRAYPDLIEQADGSLKQADTHGLRATFRTWADMLPPVDGRPKYDETTLELCLAHVVGDTASNAYKREDNVEVRRAVMTEWAAFLAAPYVAVTALRSVAA